MLLALKGATRVIGRLEHDAKRPLGQQLWAGVVDSVGGDTLAAALAQTKHLLRGIT
jgi:acrylyl-CoA reductase (NADPH)